MDVGDWLKSLGLGRYVAAFRDNSIDIDVLPDLTDGDLEKLGVNLGDRKRLLKAITALSATDSAAKPTSPAPAPKSTDVAERRQLTVVFCDLVGSTALSARLDPEDLRGIIGAYHRCCANLVERNGGYVAKYMGDGVLAYFGYPQAHEHDAERAVQTGLAVVEAAPKLVTAAGSPLHVRVGIATGLVVVGDLIGSGEAQERGVVGETPNLAARLQGIAEPDMVVIAEGTRRLLGNLFELQDLGAKDLKGISGPARVWAALRSSSAESRFEALHASGLTPLVGREEEFDLLLRGLSKAKGGEGKVVLLSGEAGIGKSRLTAAALLERLGGEPHTRLRYFCSPQPRRSKKLEHLFFGLALAASSRVLRENPHRHALAKRCPVDIAILNPDELCQHAAATVELASAGAADENRRMRSSREDPMPRGSDRRIMLGGTLAVVTAFAGGGAAQAADPIKIGVTLTQSPPGSVIQGTQVKDGLEIVAKKINDAGGIDGRMIELVIEDTQGLPEKARAAVEKLITRDKVVAITGEHQSSNVLAGMEVAHRYHIPYVNVNGWADSIREKAYPEVFNPGNYNIHVAAAAASTLKTLGAKRIVAFAENTDYGIGLAKAIGTALKEASPDVDYKFVTLDRASKDYLPAILPLRANPPDVVVDIMLPPAAYIMMNQVYEQGIAPSDKTWFYDASGLADYPDFWANVKEAGKGLLVFGLYHPKMAETPLGKEVGNAYTAKTKNAPNRLLFQSADSLYILADAIQRAKSTDPDPLIKALEATRFLGTRGTITFSTEPGFKNHQWLDVPYVTFQITDVNQKVADSALVEEAGKPLDPKMLMKP